MFILWCLMTRKLEKIFCRISLILYILGNIQTFIGNVRIPSVEVSQISNKHFIPFSCLLWIPIGEQWLFLRLWFSSTDSVEDELEMATVRHRPEALELLEAQSKFTKKELQILYRGFKNVRTSFLTLFSHSSQRIIEKREGEVGNVQFCDILPAYVPFLSIFSTYENCRYPFGLWFTLVHYRSYNQTRMSTEERFTQFSS